MKKHFISEIEVRCSEHASFVKLDIEDVDIEMDYLLNSDDEWDAFPEMVFLCPLCNIIERIAL